MTPWEMATIYPHFRHGHAMAYLAVTNRDGRIVRQMEIDLRLRDGTMKNEPGVVIHTRGPVLTPATDRE